MAKKKRKSKIKKKSSKRRVKKTNKKSQKKRRVVRRKIKSKKKEKKIDNSLSSELIIKTRPDWIKSGLANKAQYQKNIMNQLKIIMLFGKKRANELLG